MDTVAGASMDLSQFLAWEQSHGGRHEFDGVEAVALRGESLRHGLLASRMSCALHGRLDPSAFDILCGNIKVMAAGHIRCPDVVVTRPIHDPSVDIAPEPVLVVEVVSSHTRRVDRFDKNVDYAATPSIQHYVMLMQERRAAVVCSRTPDGWMAVEFAGAGSIPLPAVGVDLSFDDIYGTLCTDDAPSASAGIGQP